MKTAEIEWLDFLKTKPYWPGPQGKTVILSPHPDDETLSAGGLIADLRKKNITVVIVAITDGENSCSKIKNLREIRQQEQERALQILGITKEYIIRLKLTDSSVTLFEEKLEQLLLPLIDKHDHVLAPWIGDYHADHEAVGRVIMKITQQKKSQLSFYFFWAWQYSAITDMQHLPICIYPLETETFNLKHRALNCYVSQYVSGKGKPVLAKQALLPTQRLFEVYYPYEY